MGHSEERGFIEWFCDQLECKWQSCHGKSAWHADRREAQTVHRPRHQRQVTHPLEHTFYFTGDHILKARRHARRDGGDDHVDLGENVADKIAGELAAQALRLQIVVCRDLIAEFQPSVDRWCQNIRIFLRKCTMRGGSFGARKKLDMLLIALGSGNSISERTHPS